MPICAICGEEAEQVTVCKNCGEKFCVECGDSADKTCWFCLDDGEEESDDDDDEADEEWKIDYNGY